MSPAVLAASLALAVGVAVAAAATVGDPSGGVPTAEQVQAKLAGTPSGPPPDLMVTTPAMEQAGRDTIRAAEAAGAYEVHGDRSGKIVAEWGADQTPVDLPGVVNSILEAPRARYDAAKAYIAQALEVKDPKQQQYSMEYYIAGGKLHFGTNAPDGIVNDILGKFGDVLVRDPGNGPTLRATRNADTAPHWSGARLWSSASGGNGCTSGWIVQQANGNRLGLTAGHCGLTGSTWWYGVNGQTATMVNNSSVAGNCGSPTVACGSWDQALLGNTTFSGYMYSGPINGSQWVVQSSGSGNCSAPNSYYTSGAFGGMITHTVFNCDYAPIVCLVGTWTWCFAHLSVLNTDVYPGDSGGPLVAWSGSQSSQAAIRGMAIGGNGSRVYVEPWSRITARWGVTPVSG